MRFETNFVVPTERRVTFGYLADVRNETDWNPWAISVQKIGHEPIGEGARFRGRYRRMGTVEQWLSTYEPPQRLIYRSDKMNGRMTFDLDDADPTGTTIRLVAEAEPTGLAALISPLMTPMMRSHIDALRSGIERQLRMQ